MKNKRAAILPVVIAFFCVLATGSCTHQPAPAPAAEVSFSRDIIPVFSSRCAINSGCHVGASNANDEIDFDSVMAYSTIMTKHLVNSGNAKASLLYVEISNGIMPKAPYPHLPADTIAMILNWIEQGAKNN